MAVARQRRNPGVSRALFRTSMGIIPRDPEGLGGVDSMVLVI
jgi:hypothetical protein